MAQDLNEKVDKLVTDAEAKTVAAEVLAPPTPIEPTSMQSDPLAPEIEPIEQDPMVEEALISGYEGAKDTEPETVEIAGPLKSAAEWLATRTAKAEQKVVPPLGDQPIQELGGRFVIRQMEEDEVTAINQAMGGEYIKGLNMPEIFEGMGEPEMGEWIAKFKDANKDLFEQARRGTLNIDAIIGLANEMGADRVVNRLLKRQIGQPISPEDAVGGLFVLRETFKKTNELHDIALSLPDGVERQAAQAKFWQMLNFQGKVALELSGGTSEAARTTYASGAIRNRVEGIPSADIIAEDIQRIIGESGPEQIEHASILYGSLKTKAQRNKFAEQTKSVGGKALDVVVEIFINSILSAPPTHLVNIFGNASFGTLRLLENFVAGTIGETRGLITGTKDRATIREGLAEITGIKSAIMDSIFVSGKVLMTGEPSTGITKIDVANRIAIGSTNDPRKVYEMIKEGNVLAGITNIFGMSMRLPGRALIVEDEFFKGISYRGSLHKQAEILAGETYDNAILAGKTTDEAKLLSAETKADLINNPTQDIVLNAKRDAEVATFQQDIDGFLGQFQGAFTHPAMKMIVPFYKTPVNIFKEVAKRTPLGLMAKNKSGRDADLMMARVTVGSGIMMTFANFAMGTEDDSLHITGSGPPDGASRQALARKGIQPYSINTKNYTEDGIWDGTYTSIPYSRFDPLSGLLAMSADFAYYSNYEEDAGALEALTMAMVMGMQEYMMQLPLLEGVSELATVFGSANKIDKGEKIIEFFSRKATGMVLSTLPTVSSFAAGRERINDPTVGSTMLPETGLFGQGDPTTMHPAIRGFYSELQRAKSRNPFFSDTVEPKLNLWGEKMTAGTGEEWEFWSPVRIQETKYSPLDDEIISFGAGIKMPARKQTPPKGLKTETSPASILLNARQYNDMIRMMNEMDAYGNLPSDANYRGGETLADSLLELISNPSYQELDRERRRMQFNNIITDRRLVAKDRLFFEDDNLRKKSSGVQ